MSKLWLRGIHLVVLLGLAETGACAAIAGIEDFRIVDGGAGADADPSAVRADSDAALSLTDGALADGAYANAFGDAAAVDAGPDGSRPNPSCGFAGAPCCSNSGCDAPLRCSVGGICADLPDGCVCVDKAGCPGAQYCLNGTYCLDLGQAPPGADASCGGDCTINGQKWCFTGEIGCGLSCSLTTNACGTYLPCMYRMN